MRSSCSSNSLTVGKTKTTVIFKLVQCLNFVSTYFTIYNETMLFGEIVEPSTRALIDDESDEYPQYSELSLEWTGNFELPQQINKLIFLETDKIRRLFQKLVLKEKEVLCGLENDAIKIYKLPHDTYIIAYSEKNLGTGEIVEILAQWLQKSKKTYCITSASVSTYQTTTNQKPETLVRILSSTRSDHFDYKKLESPNIVSGLGAQVLSYCIQADLKCVLFVIYMDNSPLDSLNVNPVLQLISALELQQESQLTNVNPPPSNLYL